MLILLGFVFGKNDFSESIRASPSGQAWPLGSAYSSSPASTIRRSVTRVSMSICW